MSTFGHQSALPSLPVPKLEHTLKAYLTSVEPLLTPDEFAQTQRAVEDFGKPGGAGEALQRQLEARAAGIQRDAGPKEVTPAHHPDGSAYPDCHWLERWWETLAYLTDRTSLAVNINCFQTHFRARGCADPLRRVAWAILGTLDGRRQLAAGTVPPERAGKAVFCSAQYHRVFSTTRVPGDAEDHMYTWPQSSHICVERNGHWYAVRGVDSLGYEALLLQLQRIKADADAREPGPGVAAFTGTDRSRWARNRAALLAENADAVATLEQAVVHIVLSGDAPESPAEVQRLGQSGNGQQIWFDKSQTHLVFENGALVSNLEHTSADAVVPARVYAYVDEYIQLNAPDVGFKEGDFFELGLAGIPLTKYDANLFSKARNGDVAVERVDFDLDAQLQEALAAAKAELRAIMDDNIVAALELPDFGAQTLAKRCPGVSTDSFAQLALALAYWRDQQREMAVTYETATTRSFFHGRTETIRPQSMALRRFLERFDEGAAATAPAELAALAREAGNHHRDYLRRCMAGQGVDRHLLGLRVLAAQGGMSPMPAIFTDKAYAVSTRYTLSTSQMPWAIEDWPGFGAYDPAAYAVCYRFTGADQIVATVTSRRTSEGGRKDAKRFSEAIKQAMRDLFKLLSENAPPAAKL